MVPVRRRPNKTKGLAQKREAEDSGSEPRTYRNEPKPGFLPERALTKPRSSEQPPNPKTWNAKHRALHAPRFTPIANLHAGRSMLWIRKAETTNLGSCHQHVWQACATVTIYGRKDGFAFFFRNELSTPIVGLPGWPSAVGVLLWPQKLHKVHK